MGSLQSVRVWEFSDIFAPNFKAFASSACFSGLRTYYDFGVGLNLG
jgi:hypothetical protein